ncbi:thiol:disulfide interchange protein [Kutzneria viridogrisea]|uniref:Thiol:disulfide interchange protein n=1 Tax=Kutzneria viridogrisea TaxID=47990 RepID=A0ABR6BWF1_9PSEU|nr:thiol:disulfide interchange protein [Kutzneria viridogrisea]
MDIPRYGAGMGAALGFGAGVAGTTIAAVLGAADHPEFGLVLLAVPVALVAACTNVPGAVLAAVQCWGLWAGFLLGRRGEIPMTAESGRALVVLVAVALLAGVAVSASRAAHLVSARPPRGRAAGPSPVRS